MLRKSALRLVGAEVHAAGAAGVHNLVDEGVATGLQGQHGRILIRRDAAGDSTLEDLVAFEEDLDTVVGTDRDRDLSIARAPDLAGDELRADALGQSNGASVDHAR